LFITNFLERKWHGISGIKTLIHSRAGCLGNRMTRRRLIVNRG
jgi:hypothetical protein